jgi:alkanesulfonate monooxygenase SsuD/methylene tetrahydromethanopterin reductase-like flavin-dependent oxidoreductase (luciferase family)
MTGRLGVQITPWSSSAALVELGRKLATVVDTVWVQDQMLARNVYALLGALAQGGCGVGTNVTYPIGRNPTEMASAAATISELVPEGREMVVGMGTGGALVNSLFTKDRPITVVREAMELMRALWAGERVELDRFPVLGGTLNYKPGAVAELTYAVERPPSIVMAGVGPMILAVAGAHADGLISPSNLPTLSRGAFLTGRFGEISGLDLARAARSPEAAPLRLVYGINVSVSRDRARARAHARRQLALVVGNPKLVADMASLGIDVESAAEVKQAFDAGLGIEGAAARMSDSLVDALIVAGTPDDCVDRMIEIRDLAAKEGYDEFYVGAPLGPDPQEAAELLLTDIVPAVWPDRAARG